MREEGLYIKLLPDGKIKRRLITILGEVPLEDTTVSEELVILTNQNQIPMYQKIKDIWACAEWGENGVEELHEFERRLGAYLHWLRKTSLIRYALFMTDLEDQEEMPDYKTQDGALQIARLLTDSMEPDYVVDRTVYTIGRKAAIDLNDEHDFLKESRCIVHYLFNDAIEVEYQFRNEAQYYTFLLQHYLLSNPNVVPCQFCGRYFIPKTRKVTKYCDHIVRNNRTCKQVAPGLKKRERDAAHLVTSEFERIKDMLFHRRDRMDGKKKTSVIDLTDEEFVQWLEAATDARNRYLAGELTEKEALEIIHVPRKRELATDNSAEYTLVNSST